MRITKKSALISVGALALAGAGAFAVSANANTTAAAAVAGGRCSPHGAVSGIPTLICAPVPSSPTAYRWREIKGAAGKDGAPGKDGKDGVLNIQADGPYPGATTVQGGNSDKPFAGDNGKTIQTAWVRCPDGKVATGGGFTVQGGADDNGGDNAKDIQITGSFPFDLTKDGKFGGSDIKPDDSLRPNAWVVKGFNNGATDLTVRPFVVCVTAAN